MKKILHALDEPGIGFVILLALLFAYCMMAASVNCETNKSFKYVITYKNNLPHRTNEIHYENGFIIFIDEFGKRIQQPNSSIQNIIKNH